MPPSREPDVLNNKSQTSQQELTERSKNKSSSMSLSSLDDDDDDFDGPDDIDSFLPLYLRQFMSPYSGDFCYSSLFDYRLVAQVMSEGFLPIASRNMLLPKLHRERCVVRLPDDLHVSRSVRKKSKRYICRINHDFEGVVRGCHEQHAHCWLVPPLVEAFCTIYKATKKENHDGIQVRVFDGNSMRTDRVVSVRLYSIEIYNAETFELVAGELGYTVGTIFTSLTGFSTQDGAGSVQLAVLGRLLCLAGFSLWDLGMDMEYKQQLGAHLMPRTAFVDYVLRVRETNRVVPTPSKKKKWWCARDVIDGNINMNTG